MSFDTNIQDLVTEIATTIKGVRLQVNGNAADLSALGTTTKVSLVAAINELHGELEALSSGAAGIDDAATATSTTWSSQKTQDQINAALTALIGGAPEALNTLQELAAALEDDTFSNAVNSALAVRVSVAEAQAFSDVQKAQGRANIGAASAAEIGNTNTDYVAIFEAGLL